MPHRQPRARAALLASRLDSRQLPVARVRPLRGERRGDGPATTSCPSRRSRAATWGVRGAHGALKVTATIYALDQSVRGAYLDRRRGYFNGPCVFLLPEGRDSEPDRSHARAAAESHSVRRLALRDGARARRSRRRAASARTARPTTTSCSTIRSRSATSRAWSSRPRACRTTSSIAGRFESDLERVAADLKQICEAQIDFFGRPAPFDRYWFLCIAVGAKAMAVSSIARRRA